MARSPQARAGTLCALVGGRAEDLERARSVLEKMTRGIVHTSANGCGRDPKLVVNLGLGSYIQALSESLALGSRQGRTLDPMFDVLQEARCTYSCLKTKTGVLEDDEPQMTLDIRMRRKDIMSVVATGAAQRRADTAVGGYARPGFGRDGERPWRQRYRRTGEVPARVDGAGFRPNASIASV